MKVETYLSKFSNVVRENKLLKFGFIILLLITLVNWNEVKNIRKEERLVLMPIGASGNLWVTSENASDDYILFMSRYILHQLGDYTIHTIAEQLNELNKHFAPESFVDAKNQFQSIVEGVSKYGTLASTITFNKNDVLHESSLKKIKIKATKTRYMSGVKTAEEEKNYVIMYDIRNYRFWIKHIMEQSQ